MVEQEIIEQDPLVLIYTRNDFYRKKYHLVLAVAFLSVFVILVLAGMLFYITKNPPRPLYFVTDDVSRFVREAPVQQPNMSVDDVAKWATQAVEAAYSYDFKNYHAQLQDAQKYFADYGWRTYMKALQDSLNLVALTQRKLVVIAKVIDTPKLIAQGQLGKAGIYSYKFEMPMLVTYWKPPYDDNSKIQNPMQVSVVIQRQDLLSSYDGLGIVQLIGTFPQPPAENNLAAPPPT